MQCKISLLFTTFVVRNELSFMKCILMIRTEYIQYRVRALLIGPLSLIIIHFLSLYITQNLAVYPFFYKNNGKIWLSVLFSRVIFYLSCYSEIKGKKNDYWGEYDLWVSYPICWHMGVNVHYTVPVTLFLSHMWISGTTYIMICHIMLR